MNNSFKASALRLWLNQKIVEPQPPAQNVGVVQCILFELHLLTCVMIQGTGLASVPVERYLLRLLCTEVLHKLA